MQQNPPPTIPAPANLPEISEIPSAAGLVPHDDTTPSSLFNWSDFLDFNLDENLNISFPQPEPAPEQPAIIQSQQSENLDLEKPGKFRKGDPRLTCSNFLAGRIPCACPELDAKLAAEESAGLPAKKRNRTGRGSGGLPARCQVPGCEADISELKGYHKRHRVCLRCAHASAVVLDGESKRYCQQCGKFHILPDFDEGKRSCRRKLERHNNRRRRKQNGTKEVTEKESQQSILADDVSGDDDTGKDEICVTSQIEEREILLESDGRASVLGSALGSQNLQSDSVVSFTNSGETQVEGDKQNPEYDHFPSYSENKNIFSSVCPSGRISFKLYDWNPAEFPRRLRHQIFEWLASMPVELEGYIRPGCTILTAFIAIPKPLWNKFLEEPELCIKNLVAPPSSMLFGKGTMHVHLNDMVFLVKRDATSVEKTKVQDRAPKLHYIYPTCFEAGKTMEFVACGSYLLQSNFRFLISFAGQYLAYNICGSSPCFEKGAASRVEHQLLKIYVPQKDVTLFGPAFIEVENQSGLSNFIPILVGDKETCAEMEILQQNFDPKKQKHSACEAFALRQSSLSEFVLDVAWLLRKYAPIQKSTSLHIQRSNNLLDFLIEKQSFVVLERVCCFLQSCLENNSVDGVSDVDMRLLRKNMDTAKRRLSRKLHEKEVTGNFDTNKVKHQMSLHMLGLKKYSPSVDEDATVPLLNAEVIMNVDIQERPRKSCSRSLTRKFSTSRVLIMALMAVFVCFGVCAVALHPQRINRIATTIESCFFDNS
ncbi:Squamosa promoter-binding-like protein [Castilleja foliolosa]|uniref:Squamosa promoter-binding-like protein n=1 Tax=Castilleja foliolosa TaxID=1961234 RepID=A0ABD3DI18_9LAMI